MPLYTRPVILVRLCSRLKNPTVDVLTIFKYMTFLSLPTYPILYLTFLTHPPRLRGCDRCSPSACTIYHFSWQTAQPNGPAPLLSNNRVF